MGIETFFSALAGATRRKNLMKPFVKEHADAILFDFNSIIHRTSQILVDDLNRAMRRLYAKNTKEALVICEKYKDICEEAQQIVHGETNPHIIASIDINKLVIEAVIHQVHAYVSNLEECKLIYLAMDGVPGYGKMREQKHRRYLGEVSAACVHKIVQTHIKSMGSTPYDYTDYYKHKLSFSKSQITPGTQFMRDLCKHIRAKTTWKLSDFEEFGEGEMKIIEIIHLIQEKNIIVYSPDADMILLCLLEQGRNINRHIKLLRYDQRTNTDTLVDILTLRGYIEEHGNVEDLIFLFSVFGDDFVPRLEAMSARDHLVLVLDLYKKHLRNERILEPTGVNIKQLVQFFELLEPYERTEPIRQTRKRGGAIRRASAIRQTTRQAKPRRASATRRPLVIGGANRRVSAIRQTTSQAKPRRSTYIQEPSDGQFINALHEDVHMFMNMEGQYSSKQRKFSQTEFYKYYDINDPIAAATDYLRGLQWLRNYYYDGIFVTHWVYGYEKAPFIKDILTVLRKIKILPTVPDDPPDAIMNPMEHLVYVSPGDVSHEAPDNTTANYVSEFYKRVGLPESDWAEKVQIDCTNTPYRSKCRMIGVNVPIYHMAPYKYLETFRTGQQMFLILLT